MGFMNERQANKQAKNNLKKNQNYSRYPLTNDDNYIIMANMKNNKQQCFERFTMNNVLSIVFAFVSLIPVIAIFIL